MTTTPGRSSPRERRAVLVGCLVGLGLVAAGVVAVAVVTGNYAALVGLVAIAGGAVGCWMSIRSEAGMDVDRSDRAG